MPFAAWLRDVMLSCRGLRRRPAFTLVAIVSLALGIGANALVFSVVNRVLLQPLSYPGADRLVALWFTPPNEPAQLLGTNTGVFFTIRDHNSSFESIGAGRLDSAFSVIPGGDSKAQWIPAQLFSSDLIRTLGVEALLGEWPSTDPNGVAISYGLWQRMFGGSPDVLGKTLDLGNVTAVIQAVMPQGYQLLNPDTDLWLHQRDEDLARATRSPNRLFTLIGRLKPGVTIDHAQAEMDSLAQRIGEDFPETHAGWGLKVESLRDAEVGGFRPLLWTFQGAVFFVLLIACANLGALVMSRAVGRQKELAIRSALGSGRWRLTRQLLADNLVLSFLGAVLGIAAAWLGVRVLASSSIEGLPRLAEVDLDWRVIAFAGVMALGTGIVFGVLPALFVSRPNLMNVLRDVTRGASAGLGQQKFRAAFVVGQVSLAVVILIASGLMVRSFALITAAGVGFNPAGLTVLELPFPRTYARNTGENTSAGGLLVELDSSFSRDNEAIIERLSSLPDVRSVAASVTPPLGRPAPRVGVRLEGETLQPSEQTARSVEWYAVSPDYFQTLEIPVVRGRTFDSTDRSESRPVAIINAAMAERFWPGEDPIGQRLQTDVIDAPVVEVVGIVGNVRQDRYQRVPQAQLYVPRLQVPLRMDNALALELLQTAVIVRTDGTDGMSATLRAAVQELLPALPVSRLRAVEEYASGQVQDLRRATILLSAFGVIATVLAIIGIFGVVSHAVGQRRFELGIRMAMGARGQEITSLVIRQGVTVIAMGLGLGTLAALGLTRLVGGYLYGVSRLDPTSFAAALLVLAAAGLLASYFPARRAAHTEPVIALRSD